MLNMKSFKTSLLFMLLVVALSCSDSSGLEVIIHSPEDNATFNKGDTIVLSYTVRDDIDITTIAWDTQPRFGTGSVGGSELLGDITEYSGEFLIVADTDPGTYELHLNVTDEGITNVLQKTITINIQ